MIASVQPFGLASPGGGARILRALYVDAPTEVMSICTSISPPPPTSLAREVHVRPRPSLGRIDHTRLRSYADAVFEVGNAGLARRLAASLAGASSVNVVLHNGTALAAVEAARRQGKRYYLSVHDDIEYADPLWARLPTIRRRLSAAWSGAGARFVISDAIGREYCRRYGEAPYAVVTDGLAAVPDDVEPRDGNSVYFMGLLHLAYEPNFVALVDALATLSNGSLSARCGEFPTQSLRELVRLGDVPVQVLPYADEAIVDRDVEQADVLYLPLPFDAAHARLVKLSFSTKLITYLGSGRPILYHGPAFGPAYELLRDADACLPVLSNDPAAIVAALRSPRERRVTVARNALRVARERFTLAQQRATFWDVVGEREAQLA